jgi:hypothetical protein
VVLVHERLEIHVGQQVAVHHHEVAGDAISERPKWARRSERLIFVNEVEPQTEGRAIPEVRFDQVGEVPGQHRGVGDAVALELAQQDLQHRIFADRHQGLREARGVGPESSSATAGEDDGLHVTYRSIS